MVWMNEIRRKLFLSDSIRKEIKFDDTTKFFGQIEPLCELRFPSPRVIRTKYAAINIFLSIPALMA